MRFVPLIGAQGHAAAKDEPVVLTGPLLAKPGSAPSAARLVREVAEPLAGVEDSRIDTLVERLSSARIVLLGESTHGSSEFYRMRARITQELISRPGFDFVAAEADWPDAARVDADVRGTTKAATNFEWTPFSRFPIWMWRNEEVRAFVDWLRAHNVDAKRHGRGIGFHGLDVYSMYTSMAIVVSYLDEVDPEAARSARLRYGRLMPWQDTLEGYGLAVAAGRLEAAEQAVVATLRDMLRARLEYAKSACARSSRRRACCARSASCTRRRPSSPATTSMLSCRTSSTSSSGSMRRVRCIHCPSCRAAVITSCGDDSTIMAMHPMTSPTPYDTVRTISRAIPLYQPRSRT